MIASPYGFTESAGWLKRFFFGPGQAHPILNPFPAGEVNFAPVSDPKVYCFLGDIMSLGRRRLGWDESILAWIGDVSAVCLNVEGVFHRSPFPAFMQQFQNETLLEDLAPLRSEHRAILISMANNHSADFGEKELRDSAARMVHAGFLPIGLRGEAPVVLHDRCRVVAVTQWSNRPNPWVQGLEDEDLHAEADSKTIEVLYPHWGHEFELHPRPGLIDRSEKLHQRFPVILGHHSHIPQSIQFCEQAGKVRLTAFSLGNVAAYFKNDLVNRGVALKLVIGRGSKGEWAIGGFSWTWIHGNMDEPGVVRVKRTEVCPFFPEVRPSPRVSSTSVAEFRQPTMNL